jgi:hypothetical protein
MPLSLSLSTHPAEITLQPQLRAEEMSNGSSSQHLKVFFVRGNEQLKDGEEDVGGGRVYGGAILSKNPKNNLKWLKVSSLRPGMNPFLISSIQIVEQALSGHTSR